ncbi:arsenate reductase (glutaredoxin) [Sabulicella rubraurantiaca]|uniref:arsenate reductase (glutaredoxin) n=1 Tax=Sabulicella rubraurantiaca TaxID=2811429 RepID=UPI002E2DEEBA|nr:arsenate reductase (glutaredoxin) [Sabulicella rubraurantiaca]
MTVTIYHNPACGTSRNTLAMIRGAGLEPRVVEYLKTPPSRAEVLDLAQRMGVPLRDVLRRKGTPYDALGLDDPALTDEALLDAIETHPILLNRPIVATPKGVRLCRPSELVLDLLDAPLARNFEKEDGEQVPARRP